MTLKTQLLSPRRRGLLYEERLIVLTNPSTTFIRRELRFPSPKRASARYERYTITSTPVHLRQFRGSTRTEQLLVTKSPMSLGSDLSPQRGHTVPYVIFVVTVVSILLNVTLEVLWTFVSSLPTTLTENPVALGKDL